MIKGFNRKEYKCEIHIDLKNNKLFYFTFGLWDGYPFRGGWLTVIAPTKKDATRMFKYFYPCKHEGILNCADVYTEEEFAKAGFNGDNLGEKEHGIIINNVLILRKE